MKVYKKHYLILLLLFSFLGLQILTAMHTVDHAVEHHDHKCSLYLAGQNNDQACLTPPLVISDILFDYFHEEKSLSVFTPVFHYNFFSRAPPANSPT